MSEPRVVKKYPNRRLYDTVESRYITLGDIRRLVVERIDFVVIDKKSQTDITRSILLQVIAEQEHAGEPVMSRDFLSQVIRTYGGQMQGIVGSYLEQSLKLFNTQQREMRERVRSVVGVDPIDAVAQVTQKNYQRWRAVQDDIFRTLLGPGGRPREREDEDKSPRDAGAPPHG
ncbi:MAG: polyhydroxyalkanoate synthesis repressor PhaR [Steroidobacteraceae bacterium]